jgi:hypothetical protein
MKKLFLFIGVIIWCLNFSCKKDSPPPLPTLPIPLTIGTWWKYQRIDSSEHRSGFGTYIKDIDSSIELISVIGKSPFKDIYQNNSTVESFMLEVKNLTKGTLDTIHAFYDSTAFYIVPNKDSFELNFNLPLLEGTRQNTNGGRIYQNKNASVYLLNKTFDSCYYNEYSYSAGGNYNVGIGLKTYLKPNVGFVYWEYIYSLYSHYGFGDTRWYYRRLIDYHIVP